MSSRTIFVILLSVFFYSCSEDSPPSDSSSSLFILPSGRTVGNSSSETFFDINATGSWTISETADWFIVQPMQGDSSLRVMVTFDSSEVGMRSGSFTVNAPGHRPESRNVELIQTEEPPLIVFPTSKSVSFEEDSIEFHITAYGSWAAFPENSWISVSAPTGVGSGNISAIVEENPDVGRVGTVNISAPNHYPTVYLVTISQLGKPLILQVSPAYRELDWDITATAFNVSAEGEWNAHSASNWFTTEKANSYCRVLFNQNLGARRQDEITITASGHIPESITVLVIQNSGPEALPNPPGNVRVESIFWDEITLQWDDVSDNETGVRVERRFEDGNFETVGQVSNEQTQFTDEGLTPSTIYIYQLVSYNAWGNSEYTNPLEARTHSEVTTLAVVDSLTEGQIDEPGDMDWFECEISSSGWYSFEVSLIDLEDSEIWLYGPANRIDERASDDNSGDGLGSRINLLLQMEGLYYLKVGPKEPRKTGSYNVKLTISRQD